ARIHSGRRHARHPGVDDRAGADVALNALPPQAFDGKSFSPRALRCPNGVIWPPFSPCRCFVRIASTVAGTARWSTQSSMPWQKDQKCKACAWPVRSRSESKRNISWSRPGRSRSCATCQRPSSRRPRRRPTAVSRPSSCSRRSRGSPRPMTTWRMRALSCASCAKPSPRWRANTGLPSPAPALHPPATGAAQQSNKERYDNVMHDLEMIGQRDLLCGLHVHVELPDPDQRVDVMCRMLPYLPLFLALSTSSPFWQSQRTGLKGYRLAAYDELPR